MAYLALSRRGIALLSGSGVLFESIWVGAEVLTEAEIAELRVAGFALTVFTHSVQTDSDISEALVTIQEHHPEEAIYVEKVTETSTEMDTGNAFEMRA